jgi:uncharacterized protein YndB with AHSA1/START domain
VNITEPEQVEEPKKNTASKEKEINAPIGDVRKALTDANELARWFPLEARVTPRIGGKIFVSWGPAYEGEAEILAGEPEKKFAWRDSMGLVEWTLTLKLRNVARLVSPGKLVSEEYFIRNYGPETLFMSVDAKKR